MALTTRFSQLSPARQALVRLLQSLNYGQIKDLPVRDGDPVFDPKSVALVNVKLDADQTPRPESDLADFAIPDEVRRLMLHLDELQNGEIESIQVLAGVPRHLVIRHPLMESPR